MEIEKLKAIIGRFPHQKVMVIGDFYLDEYFHCQIKDFSPEAPVPRVIVKETEHVPGCAANIAVNFKSLGAQVSCYGIIGNDDKGVILRNKLLEKGIITINLIPDMNRKTGVFSRIMLDSGDHKQHHIRFDLENENKIEENITNKLFQEIENNIKNTDLIFIADYDEMDGLGLISNKFLAKITGIAKSVNKKTIGISRTRINQFNNFDIIICNEKEAGKATGINIDGEETLKQAAIKLKGTISTNTLVISRGKEGVSIFPKDGNEVSLPSFGKKVVDVCGAGDAFASTYSLCSLSEANEEEKAITASHAAAVAVGKLGTAPVFPEEIIESFNEGRESSNQVNSKIITHHESLLSLLEKNKNEGKKIIFTNGYFDSLHPSQIELLNKAKQMGDLLIVALNSDRSTWENLGDGRPLLSQNKRLEMISSLSSVDVVTIFDEMTPLKIISLIKPDILVKGSNHLGRDIVGKDIVEANGGEVKIITT